jgi:O-antigen ligase
MKTVAAAGLPRHQDPLPAVARRPAVITRPPQDRIPLVLVSMGVALTPLLNPKGPANTSPVDLVLLPAMVMVGLWAGTVRARLHVPYAIPAGGLAVAGLIAALGGIAPITGASAVLQEAFLLAWCAAITSVCRTPRALQVVLRTWCVSATGWAVVVVLVAASGGGRMPGATGGAGGRARLWFDHPNMAGNYFVVALFVILASRYPGRASARALSIAAVLTALLLTGSNSALLCLPIGGLVIVVLRLHSRRGPVPALAVALGLVLVGSAAWSVVGRPIVEAVQRSDTPVVRYSVGRGSRSATDRESLFTAQYELFRDGTLRGIGPSATRKALGASRATRVKEAHNDYLATLVERGPLGIVALLGLIGAVAVRTMSAQRLSPKWASVVPNPAALTAAMMGFAVTALTHEILHYRHLWALLAALAALHLFGRAGRSA